jgi:hypothetical protein
MKKLRHQEEESWLWWRTPVISALRRLKQEDPKMEASWAILSTYLKKKKLRARNLSQTVLAPKS